MKTALIKAIELILSGDHVLLDIIGVTLRMSISSSIIALIIGVPLGIYFAMSKRAFSKIILVLNRTLMGMPPVVCGLLCFMAFSGVGVLRHLQLLYTVKGMVIAQVILITPIIAGNTESFLAPLVKGIRETSMGLGLSGTKTFLLTVNECRYNIFSTYLMGFSRAIAEVGAVAMVGGAISFKTNVMTTAIMNFTNRGDFSMGVALGLILLLLSLLINLAVYFVQLRVSR